MANKEELSSILKELDRIKRYRCNMCKVTHQSIGYHRDCEHCEMSNVPTQQTETIVE